MKPLLSTLLLAATMVHAAPPLRDRLNDTNAKGQSLWIYNDLHKAFAEAKRTGKPLFVTFRCVPCHACAAFDAEVAKGSDRVANLARKEFISVRQVEMKGVDLTQFQFDYDLNWAAMFLNADGTVYARYGTQSSDGPDAYNSVDSLIKTMQRVLTLHANYPRNKAQLTGKRGAAKPYKTAMEMPGLENKANYRLLTQRNNCIHCHNIHDAENLQLMREKKLTPEKLWRYPLPENVGLQIDPKDGQRISRVLPNSPAARAGLKPGQAITHLDGQAIASIADIQWVLHNRKNGQETLRVQTANATQPHLIGTQPNWKKTDFSWRGSLWALPPRMRVYTPEVKANELARLKLPAGQGALKVKWINTSSPEGRAARAAGLRLNDYIVAINGKPVRGLDHRKFNYWIKQNYKPGDTLPITILRNGRRMNFNWPLK
ncbi:MAG: signaling protein [Verrucomicrobiales bacterium]|nr:signaling protein [Verrucomicrobiales bacterium]